MARVTAFQAVGRGFESRLPLFVITLTLCVLSCGDSNVETVKQGDRPDPAASRPIPPPTTASNSAAGTTSAVAGVGWTVPEGWDVLGPRPMRAATYAIGSGELESECAVFFFGTGQGGDVQANIDRWIGQFRQDDGSSSKARAVTGHRDINGIHVTTIDLSGTYMSGGMMGQEPTPRPGFRLLAAIVEAPDGPVFFKLIGPALSLASIQPQFDNLIGTLRKS